MCLATVSVLSRDRPFPVGRQPSIGQRLWFSKLQQTRMAYYCAEAEVAALSVGNRSAEELNVVFSQTIPGTYTVSVEAQGFRKVERNGIVLETQNQQQS